MVKPTAVQRADGEWTSTVKLSDNPNKAMGEASRVAHFKNIFGAAGMQALEVNV